MPSKAKRLPRRKIPTDPVGVYTLLEYERQPGTEKRPAYRGQRRLAYGRNDPDPDRRIVRNIQVDIPQTVYEWLLEAWDEGNGRPAKELIIEALLHHAKKAKG